MAEFASTKSSKEDQAGQMAKQDRTPAGQPVTAGPQAEMMALQDAAGNQAASRLVQNSASTSSNGNDLASVVRSALKGDSGQPLDPITRRFMESRFDKDFQDIRIHTGARATESARQLGANAYTVGRHLIFQADQFRPEMANGRRLIAHELAHSIQQYNHDFELVNKPALTSPDDRAEYEADKAAAAVVGTDPVTVTAGTLQKIGRQTDPSIREFSRNVRKAVREQLAAEEMGKEESDPYKGALVSEIVIDLGRSRVGFVTAKGWIRGDVQTDLKPGNYTLEKPSIRKIGGKPSLVWNIANPIVSGFRFNVELEGADPWTLSYPDRFPLTVGTAKWRTGAPKDKLEVFSLIDEATPEFDKSVDSFLFARYDMSFRHKGGLSKYILVDYADRSGSVPINIDSIGNGTMTEEEVKKAWKNAKPGIGGRLVPKPMNRSTTPNLWQAKQNVLKIMDDYNTRKITEYFVIGVWPILTMGVGSEPIPLRPGPGAAPRPAVRKRSGSTQPPAPAPKPAAVGKGGPSPAARQPSVTPPSRQLPPASKPSVTPPSRQLPPKGATSGGKGGQVWVNTQTGVYHRANSRFAGKTKKGTWMSEGEAKAAGYRPAKQSKEVPSHTRISQEAGRVQEKIFSDITGWPKNGKSHSTSHGPVIPDYMVTKNPKTNKWATASTPEEALFIADSKYKDATTITVTPQIRGFIELAKRTQTRTLLLMTNRNAKISSGVKKLASDNKVRLRQIFQQRSK